MYDELRALDRQHSTQSAVFWTTKRNDLRARQKKIRSSRKIFKLPSIISHETNDEPRDPRDATMKDEP